MFFDERNEGDYRIYAGALEAPKGVGYIAAVVISRLKGVANTPREAYREIELAGGRRWATAAAALSYAVTKGEGVIRHEPERLAC